MPPKVFATFGLPGPGPAASPGFQCWWGEKGRDLFCGINFTGFIVVTISEKLHYPPLFLKILLFITSFDLLMEIYTEILKRNIFQEFLAQEFFLQEFLAQEFFLEEFLAQEFFLQKDKFLAQEFFSRIFGSEIKEFLAQEFFLEFLAQEFFSRIFGSGIFFKNFWLRNFFLKNFWLRNFFLGSGIFS